MRKSLLTVLSFAALSTAVAQFQYPTNGLRALYELDNNFMNAASANYPLTAAVNGQMNASFTNDRKSFANNALDRSASSSFYNATVTDNLTDFSMGAWIKLTSYTDGINLFSTIMSDLNYVYDDFGSPMGGGGFFTIRIDANGTVQAILVGGGSNPVYSVLNSTTSIALNEWHHVAWTVDQTNSEARLYIDGVQEAFTDILITTTNNPADFLLGNVARIDIVGGTPQPSQWQIFTGIEDEVFVYDRVLTDCEVKEIAEIVPIVSIGILNNQLATTVITNATYQWYNCTTNQAIVGETNPTFSPTDGEDYYVIVNAPCISDTSMCYHLNSGTNELDELEQTISVFPNPSNEFVSISGISPRSVKLIDASGRVILVQKELMVSTKELENGVYTLIIENNSGLIISKRLIVQH